MIDASGVTVARQSRVPGDDTCLAQLGLRAEEELHVRATHAGDVLLETSCYYGTGALVLPFSNDRCAQPERDAAHAFDFSAK
ncbi:MAG: hypothetical protein F9K41_06205 [Sphingopyxis terrae]|nr:MAG: hypothetical protein F9K41_06205 [Sphingopyxis terrae]